VETDPPDPYSQLENEWDGPTDIQEKGGTELVPPSTKSVRTRITINPTKEPGRDPVLKTINDLIKTAFGPKMAVIHPLDMASGKTPVKILKQDSSLLVYFTYTQSPFNNRITGVLGISIPSSLTFSKWKRMTPGLLTYMTSKQIYWEESHLESTEIRTPLFLYGVPTRGINLSELKMMLQSHCKIEKQFSLKIRDIKEKGVSASCIIVECDQADIQFITEQMFLGIIRNPIAQDDLIAHPISRITPITLASGQPFYSTCTKLTRVSALTAQNELNRGLVRIAYTNISSIDNPFLFRGHQQTLRNLIYNLTINGDKTVHGIVKTAPGRILIAMRANSKIETITKIEKIICPY
jgi:hypothetical protein